MDLAESYQILELPLGASFKQVKEAYRRLARQFHPDTNPGDRKATERFIQVTAAYKRLIASADSPQVLKSAPPSAIPKPPATSASAATATVAAKVAKAKARVESFSASARVQFNPDLSPLERQLKEQSYEQLQQLLRSQRFPRAIALVEGLAARIPQDPEISQWQAIVYQQWGRQLLQERQFEKARIYLKKALRTDPHNRSLWAEVEKDFRRMEQSF